MKHLKYICNRNYNNDDGFWDFTFCTIFIVVSRGCNTTTRFVKQKNKEKNFCKVRLLVAQSFSTPKNGATLSTIINNTIDQFFSSSTS